MARAAGAAATGVSPRLNVSVGGLALELRLERAPLGTRETLARILGPFLAPEAGETGARVEVKAAGLLPEPLEPSLKETLLAPISRFPLAMEPGYYLALAEPYSGELNALFREGGGEPVVYAFPDGCVFGRAHGERFTVLVGEDAGSTEAAWAVLHGLYFMTSLLMVPLGGLMLHASAVSLDGEGLLFVGVSGSGKSTLVDLWGKEKGLADDCVLLKEKEDGFDILDTPFNQLFDLEASAPKGPASVRLGLFITKGESHGLSPISPGRASARILASHIHFFKNFPEESALSAFRLTARLTRKVPFRVLSFAKDRGFISLLTGEMGEIDC